MRGHVAATGGLGEIGAGLQLDGIAVGIAAVVVAAYHRAIAAVDAPRQLPVQHDAGRIRRSVRGCKIRDIDVRLKRSLNVRVDRVAVTGGYIDTSYYYLTYIMTF